MAGTNDFLGNKELAKQGVLLCCITPTLKNLRSKFRNH